MKSLHRWLLPGLLALAASAALAQAAAPASAPAQDALRAVIAPPITEARDLLAAGKFKEALAKVAEAEKVPDRSPYENFILDQLRGGAAAGAGDIDTAVRSFEAALATGRLQGADALKIIEGLVGSAYRQKDFARSVTWGQRYLAEGGKSPQVRRLLVNAYYQRSDWAGATKELQSLVGEEESAGRRPPEDLLRLLGSAQNKQNDTAGYVQTLERLLRFHPKPAYWRDRVSRVQSAAGFDDALLIDSFRLLQTVGALEEAGEYTSLADLSLRAGLPAEAQAVLEAGYAAGKLGAEQQPLRERAAKLAASDVKQLEIAPAANASANALVAQGLALATSGQTVKGLPLIEQGLAKGGVSKPDLVKLRLAWLSVKAGRNDVARAQLKDLTSVAGGLGDLARLWLIHLDKPAS
jgi:hypothetical protein